MKKTMTSKVVAMTEDCAGCTGCNQDKVHDPNCEWMRNGVCTGCEGDKTRFRKQDKPLLAVKVFKNDSEYTCEVTIDDSVSSSEVYHILQNVIGIKL